MANEQSSVTQQVRFYKRLLEKFEISEEDFLYWAGYLNTLTIASLEECAQKKCLACIRVPLQSNRLKIYAHPFRHHSFPLDKKVLNQVKAVLNCDEDAFNTRSFNKVLLWSYER